MEGSRACGGQCVANTAQVGTAQLWRRGMIAGDGCGPIGRSQAFGGKNTCGLLGVALGVEGVVQRSENAGVIGEIDLETADVDIWEAAAHDLQHRCDGFGLRAVITASPGGIDGPWPRCGTERADPASTFDGADGG